MDELKWLNSLEIFGSRLGLERINELLSKLGNPQSKLKCIHVAGTNGKGSVCAMIASVLKEQGYKVGMYTSPHLKRFTERFQVNGEEISQKRLNEIIEKIRPYYKNQTFFEIATAIGFLYFFEEKVDFLVLEVGLGGRLDATNVIEPLVSVITNISLEHTQVLGDREEIIAYEKAGIIKKGKPVVTLAKGDALKEIKKIAQEKNSKLYIPKKYHKTDGKFSVNSYRNMHLGLLGEFQLENASIALKSIDIIKEDYDISDEAIRKGMENVLWPGRLEYIEKDVVVDCAHNPGGMSALKKEIMKINCEKVISVVGILKDKDKKSIVEIVSSFSDYIVFCEAKSDRASKAEELASYCKVRNEIVKDVKKALKKAKKLANNSDLVLVTGSIYTVGEVE
jgi:dihydrofolate synthase/folylpolyglutamate synthase